MRAADWVPLSWDPYRGDKPPRLVGELLRQKGKLWEAWTPLRRRTHADFPQAGQRGWKEVACDCLGTRTSPGEENAPATYAVSQRGTGSRAAASGEKAQPQYTEATCSQGRAWVGQQQPLLVLTQAVHQSSPEL